MNDENTSKTSLEIQVSEKIGELVAALAEAQKSFETVDKNKEGKLKFGEVTVKYKYADWSEILKMVIPRLAANGLVLVQNTYPCLEDGNLYVQSAVYHTSGQFIRSYFPVCSLKSTKQQDFGANLTYAKRYGGSALLGISTEEDTDAQGSEAKTEGATRKALPKPTLVPPPHDPETGEVEVDGRQVARNFYGQIMAEGLSDSGAKAIAGEIDEQDKVLTKTQKDTLDRTLHARRMILGANTIEMLDRAQEAIDAVPLDFRKDGKLQGFLRARAAEINAVKLPTA